MAEHDETLPTQGHTPSPAIPVPAAAKPMSVRTFMFAVTTDRGPRLLAFRTSNLLIGRLPDNHLALNHTSVSRRHARIAVTAQGMMVEDLGSQNGTTINGQAVRGEKPLRPGDIVRIGHVPMYYFGFVNIDNPPTPEVVENSILVNPLLPAMA